MRQTIAALSVLSLMFVAGCQDRDTSLVVPDRDGHARMSASSTSAGEYTRVPRVGEQIHTVQAGDTLSAIAKKYAVEMAWIIKRNDITDDKKPLKVGTQLIVPRR